MSELQVKQFLMQELYKNGAEGLSFDPIVLTGPNSAIPHGLSSNQNIIKKGDTLLFDFGATIKGYKADITRTFFMIEADEYQKKAYETVRKANEIGIWKSKIPNSLHDIDNETTLILENSDYKEFIVHKTGHGLGLDVHEDPYVVRGNNTKLEQGMVITVEPGLYIPQKFGIRIEDDVLITNDEPHVLTSFSKDFRIINNE
jgi:Xaa-Pro dipeptidase